VQGTGHEPRGPVAFGQQHAQQDRSGKDEQRDIQQRPRQDAADAAASERALCQRVLAARRGRAHAERERALERVPVLGGHRVPLDAIGAAGQGPIGSQDQPVAPRRRRQRADTPTARDGDQPGAAQAKVDRLGEPHRDRGRRGLQALARRRVGAEERRMAVCGGRQNDPERQADGQRAAHGPHRAASDKTRAPAERHLRCTVVVTTPAVDELRPPD
jgi:hypothetical protein